MIRPSIKSYREDRHDHWINPERHRKHFLGRHSPFLNLPGDMPTASANVKREGKLLELEIVMPGFAKEEIDISIERNLLTVVGEKSRTATTEENDNFLMREFEVDRVYRSFEVAEQLLHEDITATYEQGILRISFTDVPTEEERAKKRVEIR